MLKGLPILTAKHPLPVLRTGILSFLLCCLLLQVRAQSGSFGLGLRPSVDGAGISGKYFIDQGFALETQLNIGGLRILEGRSYSTSTLITYNLPLPVRVMRLYFGGGCHFGFWGSRLRSGHPDEWIFGLDGIGGLEVFFRQAPVSISGELKPALNYLQEVEFLPHNLLGMTFRYYFGSRKFMKRLQ
jgi:hypothetical protein